jgi:hypothetical protein
MTMMKAPTAQTAASTPVAAARSRLLNKMNPIEMALPLFL